MATVTAGALIAAGLRRAHMTDSATGFIQHGAGPGGEAFDLLNASLSELYDILYEDRASQYSLNKPTFNTAANVADHLLDTIAGTTFYRLDGVEYFNGSRWVPLERIYSDQQRAGFAVNGTPLGYALEGANLTIYPTPAGIYQMRLRTESLPPTVTVDADTVNLQGPWREFVEVHFAVQALDKEKTDASAERQRLYGTPGTEDRGLVGRIRAASKRRDSFKPTAPVDVQEGNAAPEPWLVWWR